MIVYYCYYTLFKDVQSVYTYYTKQVCLIYQKCLIYAFAHCKITLNGGSFKLER